jgi:hypothetical protein
VDIEEVLFLSDFLKILPLVRELKYMDGQTGGRTRTEMAGETDSHNNPYKRYSLAGCGKNAS